jgi:hypothetical protein
MHAGNLCSHARTQDLILNAMAAAESATIGVLAEALCSAFCRVVLDAGV